MDYLSLVNGLFMEAIALSQYKRLGKPHSILAAVGMLPFAVLCACGFALVYAILFVYQALLSAVEYLESWIKGVSENSRHATEAVIYFSCIPTIFSMRVVSSFFSILFYFLWFVQALLTYVATLGGVRFQPLVFQASFGASHAYEVTTNKKAGMCMALILFVAFLAFAVVFVLFPLVSFLVDNLAAGGISSHNAAKVIAGIYNVLQPATVIVWGVSALVALFVFRKKKVAEAANGEN